MKKLVIFDEKKQFTRDVIEIFMDKSITNRFDTLADYCKDQKIKVDSEELTLLTKRIEKIIYDQVFYYAHLMYHYMETSGDWTEVGEQQVKITFCRNLLKIDPKVNLTNEDASKFLDLVKKNIESLNINTITKETAGSSLRNYLFKMFGKQFELFKLNEITSYLKFSGSNKFLHSGQYGSQMEFIMGSGSVKKKDEYLITFVNKEYIRTPNNVMSMAAIIGHQNIYIRMESLKTIFMQKWVQIFNYNEIDMLNIYSDPYWNIAEGIKQKVLSLYNIDSQEELIQIEKQFLKDMSETILFHELGHGIIQHDVLPFEMGAIGEASKLFGENIYTSMLEFFADFSPSKDQIKGPIKNMIDISKKDIPRATRMYFMYLSDTWFYNTEDTYMFVYSDLMTFILLRYISKDGVNFQKLEKDIFYDIANKDSNNTMFSRILDLYLEDIAEIKSICENASFESNGHKMKFQNIQSYLIDEFKKNDGFVYVDTYEFLVPFWSNVFGYVNKISDSNQILKDYFEQQQKKALKKLFILSFGKEIATKYDYDHRRFFIERMTELNIIALNPDAN